MIPDNNLSVLPWYSSIDQQNARKWWIYNKVYPLFVPRGYLLPFQIMREHRLKFTRGNQIPADDYDSGYLTQTGKWLQGVGSDYGVSSYDVTGKQYVYFNVPPTYPMGVVAVAKNDNGDVLGIFNPEPGFTWRYAGGWQLPTGTTQLLVQTYNAQFPPNGNVYDATAVVAPVTLLKAYTKNGEVIEDIDPQYMPFYVEYFEETGTDIIIFQGLMPGAVQLGLGQYYLELSDGVETWYSEIFTVIDSTAGLVKLEWWDIENFVMDAGIIAYKYANNTQFRNIVYLCADIAKPTYEFEEEVEERSGYVFPIKQVSKKVYHFSFVASEYLLDVLRFVRMSDYIRISYMDKTYALDTFLITPEWEDNGDVARVSAEFTTATVAKKVGVGYVKARRGDFNNDLNNDFNNDFNNQ